MSIETDPARVVIVASCFKCAGVDAEVKIEVFLGELVHCLLPTDPMVQNLVTLHQLVDLPEMTYEILKQHMNLMTTRTFMMGDRLED